MGKILLLAPPSPFLMDQAVFPPLSLLYLAAALDEWDLEVKVVDLGLDNNWGHFDPDVIGITGLTSHIPFLRHYVPNLKASYPKANIIVGGPHFTNVPIDAVRLGADEVCVGDGEAAILRAVLTPHLPVRQGLIDIDEWPKPARHLIDLNQYHYEVGGERATPILTSRGCPYSCAYCSKELGPPRYRDLALVEAELDELHASGFKGLQIYDDEVNISTLRLVDLSARLRRFKWRAFVRSNLFNHAQAEAMLAGGCVEVCCGVESGSDRILSEVDKRATVADATRFVRICKEVGLKCKVFLMIGLPGEDEESVRETRNWLLHARPDDFDICPFTPYPGSKVYDNLKDYDVNVEQNYWDTPYFHKGTPGEYRVVISTSALSSGRISELRNEIETSCRAELGLAPLRG